MPASAADPLLSATDVLDDHWNMAPSGRGCLALDPKTRLEKRVVRRRQSLSTLPRHRPIAVALARRGRHDQRRILELPAVQHQHVLYDELRGIAMFAVHMLHIVKADDVIAFGEQTFGPTTKTRKQVNSQRFQVNPRM